MAASPAHTPRRRWRLQRLAAHLGSPASTLSAAAAAAPQQEDGHAAAAIAFVPLDGGGSDGFGCRLADGCSVVAAAAVADEPATVATMRKALETHQLIVMDGGGSMAELRAIHICANKALSCEADIPPPDRQNFSRRPGSSGTNLAMKSFPGFSESGILGRCDAVEWEGLSGFVAPTSKWQTDIHQWHHDIKMGAGAPPLAPVVSLYCAEAPREGHGAMVLSSGATVEYAAGATLFASTRLALDLAPPALARRARRMVCHYHSGILSSAPETPEEQRYPKMSPNGIVPAHAPSTADFEWAAKLQHEKETDNSAGPYDRSRVSLVQKASDGTEYVLVNAIELDYLEEFEEEEEDDEGASGKKLSWHETMGFLDALLERGTQPDKILAHSWRAGQLVICACARNPQAYPPPAHAPLSGACATTTNTASGPLLRIILTSLPPCLFAGDNRSVFHSPTPYASHPDGTPAYAALPEPQGRRLMARTFLTSETWEPSSTPVAIA
jgi:hypothetical protein